MAVIETKGLTKYYRTVRGIEDLTLEVKSGEVFGFLGPNGAGKSTTIHLLMGLLRPSRGSVRVLGKDVTAESPVIHRRLGFLPGELALYDQMRAGDYLRYFAHLRGGVPENRVAELAERFSLDLTRKIRPLSRGNKQKVGIIQAMMHAPKLLVLDEPTAGLDPVMQRVFNELVAEMKAKGTTVFLSSHVMSEVEAVCDRVGVVRGGHLVSVETLSRLREVALRRIQVTFEGAVPLELIRGIPGVSEVRHEGQTVSCTVRGEMDSFVKAIARAKVKTLTSEHVSLEEFFFKTYHDGAGEPEKVLDVA